MATEAADPKTFESWEDAFQYPIPTIRGMEKKLRGNVEDNREKLRTLVGSSYRDLLDTARTIVDVHEQMQEVESLLSTAGQKSNARLFDRLSNNYASFEQDKRAKNSERKSHVSQTRVLRAALEATGQLIRSNGSTLLGAKLLVISRLLHKTLTPQTNMDKEGRRLLSLRVRLLSKIDRRLARSNREASLVTEDLTALALATSSSPSDVLRHFLHIRSEVIRRQPEGTIADGKAYVLSTIRLYFGTLQECRSIFPDLLKSSLRALSNKTILKDDRIKQMDSLNLDVHEPWIRDEVRNYIPWTRSEELTRDRAKDISTEWARTTFVLVVESVKFAVAQLEDFDAVTELRKAAIQEWLSPYRSGSDAPKLESVISLSDPFQRRLTAIAQSSCGSLLKQTVKDATDALSNATTLSVSGDSGLWSEDILALDTANGAALFRRTVTDRRLGKNKDTHRILSEVDKGVTQIEKMRSTLKTMQTTRWDDDLDVDEDDSQLAAQLAQALSEEQPAALRKALNDAAQFCREELERRLTALVQDGYLSRGSGSGLFIPTTMRIMRELHTPLSALITQKDPTAQSPFCRDLIDTCVARMTEPVTTQTSRKLQHGLLAFARSTRRVDALWDGKPPLPAQPSPASFRYLQTVTRLMESDGTDLWSQEPVNALKSELRATVAKVIPLIVEELDSLVQSSETIESSKAASNEEVTNGDETTGKKEGSTETADDSQENTQETPNEENIEEAKPIDEPIPKDVQKPQKLLQLLFDALYLRQACSTSHSASNNSDKILQDTLTKLEEQAQLDAPELVRLRKNAVDYWKRTYLLFGLLAHGQ